VVREAGSTPPVEDPREFTLDLIGQDRPGIVRDVARILAKHSLNVQELETSCQSASMSAESLFMAHAPLTGSPIMQALKICAGSWKHWRMN